MSRFTRTVVAFLLVSFTMPSAAFAEDEIVDRTAARVERVESGDVLVVKLAGSSESVRVRVLGIDCGKSARGAASELIASKEVSLRSDKPFLPILQDQLGRYVAYVETTDGEDFGLEMLKSGKCTNKDWKIPHPKGAQYAQVNP